MPVVQTANTKRIEAEIDRTASKIACEDRRSRSMAGAEMERRKKET